MTKRRSVREVWAWNFQQEFEDFKQAVATAGAGSFIALDTEFPGFLYQEPKGALWSARYQALRLNVEMLRPIQIGLALAACDGTIQGVWTFNFQFNAASDWHTEAGISFLLSAGVDLPRHAEEGIDPRFFGRRIARSNLFRRDALQRLWITFSGAYDLAYMLKILTTEPLPEDAHTFDIELATFCPIRIDLQDSMRMGSLESLVRMHGVERCGQAHTAGSDALATLELYLRVVKKPSGTRDMASSRKAAIAPTREIMDGAPFVNSTSKITTPPSSASDDVASTCSSTKAASSDTSAGQDLSNGTGEALDRHRSRNRSEHSDQTLCQNRMRDSRSESRPDDDCCREPHPTSSRYGAKMADILKMMVCVMVFNCLSILINTVTDSRGPGIASIVDETAAKYMANL